MARVIGVAGARDDHQLGPETAGDGDDVVDLAARRIVMTRARAVANPQRRRKSGFLASPKNTSWPRAATRHGGRIALRHDVGNAVRTQHLGDELAHPAAADDDGVRLDVLGQDRVELGAARLSAFSSERARRSPRPKTGIADMLSATTVSSRPPISRS